MIVRNVTAFLLTMTLWCSALGCYNKQRLGLCPRSGIMHEKRCPGVDVWKCKHFQLRCFCTRNAFRRSDGKCVEEADCAKAPSEKKPAGGKKKIKPQDDGKEDSTGSGGSPDAQPPESPSEEHRTTSYDQLYYSGNSNLCPHQAEQCVTLCKNQGYTGGTCDSFLRQYCYCYDPIKDQQQKSPAKSDSNHRLPFPYGRVFPGGDLIQNLRASHGCPSNEDECFQECRQRGVKGAFCGRHSPHHCFCGAYLPESSLEYSKQYEETFDSSQLANCTNVDICEGTCTALDRSGGFCPKDDPFCYCYLMYPVNRDAEKYFEKQRSSLQNFMNDVEKILQSDQKIMLIQISYNAWATSECFCIDSDFQSKEVRTATRRVGCHAVTKSDTGTYHLSKKFEVVTFQVIYDQYGTKLQLTSEAQVLPFGFEGSHLILTATESCFVTQIGEAGGEKPLCALWGLAYAGGVNEQACFDTMYSKCMKPVTDAYSLRLQHCESDETDRSRNS